MSDDEDPESDEDDEPDSDDVDDRFPFFDEERLSVL